MILAPYVYIEQTPRPFLWYLKCKLAKRFGRKGFAMKKLLIAVVVLVLVVAGVLVFAVMNANSIAQRYKPDLEKMASDALGSTVTFGSISASVFPTAKLVVENTTVESEGETMTLDNLSLRVALIPLLSRNLQVQELVLQSPKVTVYLEKDGVYIAGLPREKPAAEESEAPPTEEAGELPITVSLENVALRDATIAIVDKAADTEYIIKRLNLAGSLGFENNVVRLASLDGGMVILEDVNVDFKGRNTTFDLSDGALAIEEMTAKALGNSFQLTGAVNPENPEEALRLSSQQVDLASLGPIYDVFAPGINDLGISGVAKPDLAFAWQEDGRYRADGSVVLSKAAWQVAELPLHDINGTLGMKATEEKMSFNTSDTKGMLRDAPFTVEVASSVDNKRAGLETLTVNIFEGVAKLDTQIQLEGEMPFESKLDMNGMQLDQIVTALAPDTPVSITGTLQSVGGQIEGTFNDQLPSSVTGNANMNLADGLVKDVNIGKEALGKVSEIPFLSGTLLAAVPENLREFVEKDHTALESVTGTFDIANEQMTTEDLVVESDFFRLDSKGTIGFDQRLDLNSVIYFTKGFSDGLAAQTKELRVLFNEEGRLAFPVKISGVPPDLSVVPDVSDLVKRAATGTVREKAKDVIKGIVGGDKETTEEGGEKKRGLLDRLVNP